MSEVSETKWTPGKLEAHIEQDYVVVMCEGECTENASIQVFGEDADKLAQLIAAAPDLLEALIVALPFLSEVEVPSLAAKQLAMAALRSARGTR